MEGEKKQGFWKKHLWDFVLLFSLLLGTGTYFAIDRANRSKTSNENLYAEIYVSSSLYKRIDLTKAPDQELLIEGTDFKMTIAIKDHAISVKESSCPGQECVKEGWVKEAGHPILCAYNHVLINLVGASFITSVEIG